MAKEAITKALDDCKLSYDKVEQACVGYVFGKYSNSKGLENIYNQIIKFLLLFSIIKYF